MIQLLTNYIDSIKAIHSSETFWVANSTGVIVYENNSDTFDIKNMKFYIDENHGNLIWSNLILHLTQEEELGACESRNKEEIIAVRNDEFEPIYYLFEVHKLLNSDEFIGFLIINSGSIANFEYANLLNHICFAGKRKKLEAKLSLRELEIIYFIIRGKTYQEIADILTQLHKKQISASSIGKMVRNSLYNKLNVWNKFELKQLLLHSSYINKIPATIYKNLLNTNFPGKEYLDENS